jgi:hypothetical protein
METIIKQPFQGIKSIRLAVITKVAGNGMVLSYPKKSFPAE